MQVLSILRANPRFLVLKMLGLLLFSFFAFGPKPAIAFSIADVVLSEIAWMGTEIKEVNSLNWWRYEWLELYNNTEQKIILDGWKIEFFSDALDWTLLLSGKIEPQKYFLAVSSDKIFPVFDLNYSNLSGKLKNGGQKLIIKDAGDKIVEEIDCSLGWFAGNNETKQTMERTDLLLPINDRKNWSSSQKSGGTPRAKNSAVFVTSVEAGSQTSTPKETTETQGFSEKRAPDSRSFSPLFFLAFGGALLSGMGILYLKKKTGT